MAIAPTHPHAGMDNTVMAQESGLAPPPEINTRQTHDQDFARQPTPDIPIYLHFGLHEENGSASLSGDILVTHLPEGATLSLGKAWPPHRWIIPEEYLVITATNDAGTPVAWTIPQLSFSPPPHDRTSTYLLEFMITMRGPEGLYTETGQLTLDLTLDDTIPATNNPAPNTIPLNIHLELHDPENQETFFESIVLTDVPPGTELNQGTPGLGATWIIGPETVQKVASNDKSIPPAWTIPGLTITPPVDMTTPFVLGIQVTTTCNGQDTTQVHKGHLEVGTSLHPALADDLFDFDHHPRETPQDNLSEQGWIQ